MTVLATAFKTWQGLSPTIQHAAIIVASYLVLLALNAITANLASVVPLLAPTAAEQGILLTAISTLVHYAHDQLVLS